jgi:hypothetical protein
MNRPGVEIWTRRTVRRLFVRFFRILQKSYALRWMRDDAAKSMVVLANLLKLRLGHAMSVTATVVQSRHD